MDIRFLPFAASAAPTSGGEQGLHFLEGIGFDLTADDDDNDHAPPAPAAYLMAQEDDPSQAYERADSEDHQLELLREGMQSLDARSRDIVRRRWLDDENKVTLQELADEYGVSAERIRQVEANALKKMKALFAA